MEVIPLALASYAAIITVGYAVNKYLRLPWMFTTVILGMVLSAAGLFREAFAGASFAFLSQMGMLFFLFTIGLDLDLGQMRHLGRYIVGGDLLLTFTEGLLLALFFYFVLPDFVNHSFVVALISGIAFGTVGEVVLLAILKEFGMESTRFGQLALGIGVFDDVFEILALAAVIALPAFLAPEGDGAAWGDALGIVLTLGGLIIAALLAGRASRRARALLQKVPRDSFVPPFLLFGIIFLFIYLGATRFANMGVVAAIFGGIAVKQLLPEPWLQQYKKPVFFVANIFLGPFFFLSLGSKVSLGALVSYPLVIVAVVAIALASRITLSYALFNRLLGRRQAVVLGIGLTSKFNTSIITENLLLASGLITAAMYTVLMGAFIVLKPIIVGAFARGVASVAPQRVEAAVPMRGQQGAIPSPVQAE